MAGVRPEPAIPDARPRVLVVDDEDALCRALARGLRSEYRVETDSSGRGALGRILRGERFDAIVTDVMMPQMSGMTVHAEIASVDAAQASRMIFMTGSSFEDAARAFLEGVDGRWIHKPFDRRDLAALLRRVIAGSPVTDQ